MPRLSRTPTRLGDRLAAIEVRLLRLEAPAARPAARAPKSGDRDWILEGLRARLPRKGADRHPGRLGYAGMVLTPAGLRYHWRGEHSVEHLLQADWSDLASALGALGHPVRLHILRALIRGVNDVRELQRQPGLGTSGQLYHHLRELQAAGWVRQQQRSRYLMVPDRVVAMLLIMGIVSGPDPRPEAPARKRRKR